MNLLGLKFPSPRLGALIVSTFFMWAIAGRSAEAAVTFTGGGSDDLVVTITSDLKLPVYGPAVLTGIVFNVVLKDVYLTDRPSSLAVPQTLHANGVQAIMDRPEPFADLHSTSYQGWGVSSAAPFGLRDLVLSFVFPSSASMALKQYESGRVFVLTAGSVTIPASAGLDHPDLEPSTIELRSHGFAIPEVCSAGLTTLGIVSLSFRRVRNAPRLPIA